MLNWIIWRRTVYMFKNGVGINNAPWLMCHKTKLNLKDFSNVRVSADWSINAKIDRNITASRDYFAPKLIFFFFNLEISWFSIYMCVCVCVCV